MRAPLWTCLILLLSLQPTLATPASLLRNGGFESPAGWTMAEGASLDGSVRHSGQRSLKIETSLGVVSDQLVYGVTGGQTLSLSGWVKTSGVAPRLNGGFAFVAVYQYDTAGRLAAFRDYLQLSGTNDWTPVNATLQVAAGVEYVAVHLGMHNSSGTAWFDDINLVQGAAPDPWSEPSSGSAHARPFRAAIFDDPSFPVTGYRTPSATFRQALKAEGIPVTSLDAKALADSTKLNTEAVDLLIVPTGASFPLPARQALLGFLLQGGHLLCTGGYAFDDLRVPDGAKWKPYTRYMAEQTALARDAKRSLAPNGGFEEGTKGWEPTSSPRCTVVEESPYSGSKCGKVVADSVESGGRWGLTLPVEQGKSYLVGAQIRTKDVRGSGFAFLAVYQYGADDQLVAFADYAHVTGTTDWAHHEYSFQVAAGATKVQFHAGLYLASGTAWVDEVTCAPLPHEERINAHYGEPGDALRVAPTQLTIFSPDQPLTGARLAWAGSHPSPNPLPQGAGATIRGFEATAQLRQNARWTPLLEARDEHGRVSGVAGALVTNFAGPFTGGRWAIFGVTNRDVFAGAAGQALLRRTLHLLRSGVSLERLSTPYATYKRGETAEVTVEATNVSREPRSVTLRVVLSAPTSGANEQVLRREQRTLRLGANDRQTVKIAWRASDTAPDFVILRAEAVGSGELLDRIESGFCVYDEKAMASGRPIAYRDNGFDLAQQGSKPGPLRATLFGTDTYGNMFWSRTCSPLTWYRDAQAMRDAGLHMYENLQFAPPDWTYTEAQWRQFDGVIQISQRFGLPYMAGLLIGQDVVVDDATLAKQAEMCRQFAARYKKVPGLLYYLNGDFVLNLKDEPDIRRIWNDLLRARYGTDEALRKAWAPNVPAAAIGQIPVQDGAPGSPFDVHARDIADLRAALVKRWVNALCAAIRSEDTVHPITSEYYQRPTGGIDVRLTIGDMDAANYGYFDAQPNDITKLLATAKWNDMRAAGKTVNMGEYGVKTHDAWGVTKDASGYHVARTDREMRRLFWYVAHAAWGLDITKIQNWCWSDDPDNIFPWGMAWQNPMRLKPAGKLLRNLRLFSDRVGHGSRVEPVTVVLPDRWRLGAPELIGYGGLMNALECMLATNVSFDVANQSQIEQYAAKPDHPRALVLPFAQALPNTAIEALLKLANAGWRIYLSGDVAIQEDGSAAPDRSALLTGGEKVDNPLAIPLTRKAVGAGAIWHSPQTWEALTGHDVFGKEPGYVCSPANNLYLTLLPLMGVKPGVAVTSAGCKWIATMAQVPPASLPATNPPDRYLVSAYPRTVAQTGPATVKVTSALGELAWGTEQGWPCAALVTAQAEPVAATGGKSLSAIGGTSIAAQSPWMAVALDDRPIRRSSALAVALTDGGAFTWRSEARDLGAWIVEWRDGQAVVVAPAPLSRTKDAWSVRCPANDLIVVCPTKDRARWLKELARR